MRHALLQRSSGLALLLTCAVCAPVRAGEPDTGSDAAVIAREFSRARIAEAERSQRSPQRGVVITSEGMLFLDGPAVPLEWVEYADGASVRRMRRPTITDTVVKVGPGVTLQLVNLAGDIAVSTWPRNEVRIVAEHDRSDRVVTELANGQLKLGVSNRREQPSEVEWNLTVPVWLPLQLSGVEGDIEVEGMRSAVQAQTMRGDVYVKSCRGSLQANSIEGEVHVSDVDGNVTAGSVNNLIRLLRVNGPVDAQTINGDIQLERIASPSIDASSVNGQVLVASPFSKHGRYSFSSHSGRVLVAVPDGGQNVNVTVQSFNGQIESTLPLPAPAAMPAPVSGSHGKGKSKSRSMRFVIGETPGFPAPASPATPTSPPSPRSPQSGRPAYVGRNGEVVRIVQVNDPAWAPEAPQLEVESFGGLIRLASQEEVLRAIDAQRAALDSARANYLRARRDEARARRALRESQRAPVAPTPPPPGQR